MAMYPPAPSQYARIPTDPNEIQPSRQKNFQLFFSRYIHLRPHFRLKWILSILISAIFLFSGVAYLGRDHLHNLVKSDAPFSIGIHPSTDILPSTDYSFPPDTRPAYLDIAPAHPLALRLAIMSRRDEFDRRQGLRDYLISGNPKIDVQLEYRFFVGGPGKKNADAEMLAVSEKIENEQRLHGDMMILGDIEDIPERLSEKRYSAVKWAGDVPSSTYDYFITLDSDTFCRLGTFARHLPALYTSHGITPMPNPRESPILIGRLSWHWVYFLNTVEDGQDIGPMDVDQEISGPGYSYPSGIGYVISSSLVATILSASPPLPHHIHYPSDDVMIGAWVAGLRHFPVVASPPPSSQPDPPNPPPSSTQSLSDTLTPRSPTPSPSEPPSFSPQPTPYLSYSVNTTVLDDISFHDYPGRGGHDALVSWESVCMHRISVDEMRRLRAMNQVRGEWD